MECFNPSELNSYDLFLGPKMTFQPSLQFGVLHQVVFCNENLGETSRGRRQNCSRIPLPVGVLFPTCQA